jgi:hypothetical protein
MQFVRIFSHFVSGILFVNFSVATHTLRYLVISARYFDLRFMILLCIGMLQHAVYVIVSQASGTR